MNRRPDLILINGNILTVDEEFTRAEAIMIDNGRILKVGANRDVEPFIGQGTVVVNLRGKTVIPGFHDAHSHMWTYGFRLSQVDCRSPPTSSITEIVQKIQSQAEQTPSGKWVVGWGYDDTKLVENRHPTREDLDEVSPNHPVTIHRTCGVQPVYASTRRW